MSKPSAGDRSAVLLLYFWPLFDGLRCPFTTLLTAGARANGAPEDGPLSPHRCRPDPSR